LRWRDIDFAREVLHVRRSWDRREGPVKPKSRAGLRAVPVVGVLRDQLLPLSVRTAPDDLVFGRSSAVPFSASAVVDRATPVLGVD
jgi:hypothetical protein